MTRPPRVPDGDRMHPSLAKRFRSGRSCLDFAHTAATDHWSEPELIVGARDLQQWLEYILQLETGQPRDDDVAAALQLRAAVLALARARALQGEFALEHISTLNQHAAAAPPVPHLSSDGLVRRIARTTVAAALSVIARDAVELFGGPLGHRIRVCAAEDCQYLFVDASRPGTRRWCSMQRCGNLTKVRTHRAARVGAAADGLEQH